MIKNYLSYAIKHLQKQKVFSLVNLLGLTVGITCCFMIFMFIVNELSYDDFHTKGKNIYRVYRVADNNGVRREIPYLSAPFGPSLVHDYPDAIKQAVRIMKDNNLISYKNVSFNEQNIYLTDNNFFDLFDFKLLSGHRSTVLKEPNSIVLTQSAAKKYFGDEDPMGKVLVFNGKDQLKVTGIASDVPVNSHLQFDMVIPLELLRATQPDWFDIWPSNSLFVYLQLNPTVDPAHLNKLFPAFMDKYLGKFYAESGFKMDLIIKPFRDIYFAPDSFDNVKHGNKKMVYIFMSIAILILVIACINFINLATARATDRAKEVGLRKTLGAMRNQLVVQFMSESLMLATMACMLSLGLVLLLKSSYAALLGYPLPSFLMDPRTYIFLISVILIVGLLAGSYPAFLLSSFSPIESLKGKLRLGTKSVVFRKSLVVFQFGISVVLIISVITVMRQMKYLRTTDLGFDKEQSMIVRLDNQEIRKKRDQFKNELMRIPSVRSVSMMSGEPGGFHDRYSFEAADKPGVRFLFNTEYTDFDYISTLGLQVIAGRDFSPAFATDSGQAALINRHAAADLGYTPEEAIGKRIKNLSRDSASRTIVGVIENYHYASMKDEIGSLVISPGRDRRLALIKLKAGHLPTTIHDIQQVYTGLVPVYPFEYDFLDERLNRLYKAEAGQQTVLGIFSTIAILIACLGLFGLASYTAVQRTKEIGVRKVLGSSVSNIVLLLSRDLMQPVLIGTLVVLPVGYYVMNKWLQGFAYRIDFQWWMFGVAILLSMSIAFFTIGIQAVKAAVANPMKSLKVE